MLNQRQRQILKDLIEHSSFISVHELADCYRVSERSIRYDLEAIEYALKKYGLELERHKLRGVQLVVSEENRQMWLKWLTGEPEYSNRLSPEERRNTILGVLFRKQQPVNSTELSELLHVSRRTVADDLKRVEAWLEQHNLSLQYFHNKGYRINGREQDIRLAYAALVPRQPDTSAEWLFSLTGLSYEELDVIREVVTKEVKALPYELTDSALDGLVFHIAVAVERLRQGNNISMPEKEYTELKDNNEFYVALSIAQAIGDKLDLSVPEAEAGYITLHLLGAKMLYEGQAGGLPKNEPLRSAVDRFIIEVGARLGTDFSRDGQLRQGLIVHLRPTLYRLKYNLRLENPFKEHIVAQYGEIVGAVKRSIHVLEETFHVSFNDNELAFLAMHVGAALERLSHVELKPRVLLVCGSGVGTAQLLLNRIRRHFPDLSIVGTKPLHQLSEEWLKREKIGWIISTIPIHGVSVPYIVVNPFLTVQDRQKITSLIQREHESTIQERGVGPVLEEVLTPELIRLDVEVKDWEEAVRQAGQLLVNHGKVEQGYVDAMVRMIEENGPYIVIDKGVAMPHARPEDGVKSLGLSLVRLSTPIEFGHEQNDPVTLVLCLGSIDAEMHLNALRQLMQILNDDENKQVLMTADKQSILQKIQEFSKT